MYSGYGLREISVNEIVHLDFTTSSCELNTPMLSLTHLTVGSLYTEGVAVKQSVI